MELRWLILRRIPALFDLKEYRDTMGCGIQEAKAVLGGESRELQYRTVEEGVWHTVPTEVIVLRDKA